MDAQRSNGDGPEPGAESNDRAGGHDVATPPSETFEPDELDGPAFDLDRRLDDANPQPGGA